MKIRVKGSKNKDNKKIYLILGVVVAIVVIYLIVGNSINVGLSPEGFKKSDFINTPVKAGDVREVSLSPGNPELVLKYDFESTIDKTDVGQGIWTADTSGNGLHGFPVLTNLEGVGKNGKGAVFNGNYISAGNDDLLDLENEFTIGGWFSFENGVGNARLITKEEYLGGWNSDWSYRLFTLSQGTFGIPTDRVYIQVKKEGGGTSSLFAPLPTKVDPWYHLIATYDRDDGNFRMYVDGVEASSLSVPGLSIKTNDAPLGIGGAKDASSSNPFASIWNFNGKMDEVRVYDYALSESEINDLMNEVPVMYCYVDAQLCTELGIGLGYTDLVFGVISPSSDFNPRLCWIDDGGGDSSGWELNRQDSCDRVWEIFPVFCSVDSDCQSNQQCHVLGICVPSGSCSETDLGDNYDSQGTLSRAGNTYTDYCFTSSNSNLREYSCTLDQPLDSNVEGFGRPWDIGLYEINYDCPNGCSNGACL